MRMIRRTFIFCFLLLLLTLASIAISVMQLYRPFLLGKGENTERRRSEIDSILDGTLHLAARSRYPVLLDKLVQEEHHSYGFHERRWPVKGSGNQIFPVQLRSPRYTSFLPQFHSMLLAWVEKKRYDAHVMKELLHLVKEPIDRHYGNKQNGEGGEAGTKPYKTCAVVGNSGILLNQSYAALIDNHDMVTRLNNARISHYEQYVGSKTTLSFVNSNILRTCSHRTGCFCHPYGAEVPLIMYICQIVHLMDVAMCSATHTAPIIVTDARFDALCARIVKYYSLKRFMEMAGRPMEEWSDAHEGPLFHYSSGMQAVLLAVGICERVSLFGFGKAEAAKHHYHTSQKEELNLHDYEAEYDFYKDLATQDPERIPFLNEAGFPLPSVHIYW